MALTPSQSSMTTGGATVLAGDAGSYVDWPAIFAGAIFATALSFVLITFGSGIGLSMVSPEPGEGVSMRWFTIAAGIWFVWVAVTSFAAGGYLSGRMRRPIGDATSDEVETRDGAHGVVVWATGALIGAVMAASGVSGLLGASGSVLGAAAETAATAAEGQGDYFANLALRETGADAETLAGIREEVMPVVQRSLIEGEISDEDQQYLIDTIAARTGTDPATVQTQVTAAVDGFRQARDAAAEAADQARIAGVIAAFVIAASLLIGAAAAYSAAVAGGHHRDNKLVFPGARG